MTHLDGNTLQRLNQLKNDHIVAIVETYAELLQPSSIKVITDQEEDFKYIREKAIEVGDEIPLDIPGHTVHFDGYYDQARDVKNTKILINKDVVLSDRLNTMDRDEGLREVLDIMKGAMRGKEMVVCFFALGPVNSRFTQCAMQITDSFYIAHSEDILYRNGFQEFKRLQGSDNFFLFVHSAGQLENKVSKNIDKRRIYIDLLGNKVLSVNNQYAGNSLGLKKHALRLAIYKANKQDWLTEHMFIMGVRPAEKKRTTYFCGAYPSASGKTSTAMIPGQTVVGDDIVYIRDHKKAYAHAVNIESGIFGIIQDVNPRDDPFIHHVLVTPRELIFSNVLIHEGKPYWKGMGIPCPESGRNHFGDWTKGIRDENGNIVPVSHPNARYTIRIRDLQNIDPNLNNPDGVRVEGIFYGGRDSDTNVPIHESLSWEHGVFIGATIESETTFATLGETGVPKFNPMANLDFLVVSLGEYLSNHYKFGARLKHPPRIFATNYFLKIDETYCNEKVDKKIWVLWAEGRVHKEYDAIKTPIGFIPHYEDLKLLFQDVLNRIYTKEQYAYQFSLRIGKLLKKLERIEKFYSTEHEIPEEFWNTLQNSRKELFQMRGKFGKDTISPFEL
ncbi:MAG: phosphoenolpyruvate carboxykinase (GTP) [Candidatus Lokiarchaeota archaeon]|nr:phosphoenolpyruvate carboxykinase (GTP) [Candidatus Lokiarchaeota archaeon]